MKRREAKSPYMPSVEHIELNESKIKPRIVLTVLFLVIGVVAITYGVVSLTKTDIGWSEIEADSSLSGSVGGEIVFSYNLGASGAGAGVESRAIEKLYTEAVDEATKLYNNIYYAGTSNIYTVNSSPNESVQIETELYNALEFLLEADCREIFYAPYYDEYTSLFFCENDNEAYNFDPNKNDEIKEYFSRLSELVNDENHVSLSILGDNTVCLNVSEEYLTLAEEYGVTSFIDLYWMKNAFVLDYIADKLIEAGYVYGSLSSFDGYVRNLDNISGTVYGFDIYDRVGNTVYPAAIMKYSGRVSIVNYRNFPMTDLDVQYYYESEDGIVTHKYISPDGYNISSCGSLVAMSQEKGCAEVLVESMSLYLAEELDKSAVNGVDGISLVYCEDGQIITTSAETEFESIYDGYTVKKCD